jgi:hypothetical protein
MRFERSFGIMEMKNMRYQAIVCVLGGIMLASCGGGLTATATQSPSVTLSPASTPSPQTRSLAEIDADLNAAWAAVAAEIGNPVASDVSQCATMPAGAKSCGGPSRYIVYSLAVSNETRLQSLVTTYTDLTHERNAASGAVSDCMMLTAPAVELVAGVCKAK